MMQLPMPRFMRNSLRAQFIVGVSLMVLSLVGVGTTALIGLKKINVGFYEIVGGIDEELHPTRNLQIALLHAVMPANDYLIHGETLERKKFSKLSDHVEQVFYDVLRLSKGDGNRRELITTAFEEWRASQLIALELLSLPAPVGNIHAAEEMKRMDAHIENAINLLEQIYQLTHEITKKESAKAYATGRSVIFIVFCLFWFGLLCVFMTSLFARSIFVRISRLIEGAQAFGTGDLSFRVQLGNQDELGRLADAFNTMATELDTVHRELNEAATLDPLTKVFNRREFDRRIAEELQRSVRYRHPLFLLILDLDHFKTVNDNYGHLTGDLVLREAAQIIRGALRSFDLVARYGGEEFVVIAPETDEAGAHILGERIRAGIEAHEFLLESGEVLRVTASIGIAGPAADTDTRDTLVAAADSALYAAKHDGRNCVRLCSVKQFAEQQL